MTRDEEVQDDSHDGDPRDRPDPVEIPHTELSPDSLRGVIDNFILREGTDYGERDVSHESKVTQVMRQLERGEAKILFDPVTESVDIVAGKISRREHP